MKRTQFVTELKLNLTDRDFLILRNLYTPVVGKEAIMLYSLLFDYHHLARHNGTFYNFHDLAITLDVSEEALLVERKKLEAVGLIRTFEKADNVHFIIKINEPLSPEQFRANHFLYKAAIAKIGELMFERIEFSIKSKQFAKDEYKEVSSKYQDMFTIPQPVVQQTSTLEMALPSFSSKEEAISGLTAPQFIHFLTGAKVSPSQLTLLQQTLNQGFSSKSINLIIDYSYEINDCIVGNHIKKIAEDLLSKDIRDSQTIERELVAARAARKGTLRAPAISAEVEEGNDTSWEDLFKSLGGNI